jgi:uncharacterized protein
MAVDEDTYQDEATIRRLLTETSVWAMVGLSNDRTRVAYRIAAYLREHGKRVVPVHPKADEVAGEPGYRTVADIPFPVDVVDLFVRAELAGPVVDAAIAAGIPAVWLQVGVVDRAAAARARTAGLAVVMDTCPHIQGPRLLGW